MISPESNIVILTGAGISAESGLPTFRDANGLWQGHRIEDVASPEGFARDPELVHEFYNQRRAQLKTVEPNAGHQALARLEREWSGGFLLVTQNVDDLHERAGSENLIHMHGELRKARCGYCGAVLSCSRDVFSGTRCRACGEVGGLRPHIVWFGEFPLETGRITTALRKANLFVSIGTSGMVYPAAGFVHQAKEAGAETIEINNAVTEASAHFDRRLTGPATVQVPAWVAELLELKKT